MQVRQGSKGRVAVGGNRIKLQLVLGWRPDKEKGGLGLRVDARRIRADTRRPVDVEGPTKSGRVIQSRDCALKDIEEVFNGAAELKQTRDMSDRSPERGLKGRTLPHATLALSEYSEMAIFSSTMWSAKLSGLQFGSKKSASGF